MRVPTPIAKVFPFLFLVSACSSDDGPLPEQTGGATATGGTIAVGGTTATGGTTAAGRTSNATTNLLVPERTACEGTSCRVLLSGTVEGVTVSVTGLVMSGADSTMGEDGWTSTNNFDNGGFFWLEGTVAQGESLVETITRGVIRISNEQPNGGVWYCVGGGTVTDSSVVELTRLSRLGRREELSETTDSLNLSQTWFMSEGSQLDGKLDGQAFTAVPAGRASFGARTEQSFVGNNGQEGYLWSWLAVTQEQEVLGIYEGAVLLFSSTEYSLRLGGVASSARSETKPGVAGDGRLVTVDLANLEGPLTCPGTEVEGTLTAIID